MLTGEKAARTLTYQVNFFSLPFLARIGRSTKQSYFNSI